MTPKPRKRATLAEIAASADVSLSTASRVMRSDPRVAPDTRERVLASARALDFRPNKLAHSLKTGTASTMLALLIPDVDDPFFASVAGGIQDAAAKRGYVTMLGCHKNSCDTAERIAAQVVGFRPAALIMTPADRDEVPPSVLDEVRFGTPVLLLDRPASNLDATAMVTNNEEAMTALTRGLLAQGVESFVPVCLSAAMWTQAVRLAALRECGAGRVGRVFAIEDDGGLDAAALCAEIAALPGRVAVVGLSVPPLIQAIAATDALRPRPAFACFDTHVLFERMSEHVYAVAQDARGLGERAASCVLDMIRDGVGGIRRIVVPASGPRFYGGVATG